MNRLPNKTRWKALTTGCLIFWVVQVWGQAVVLREEATISGDVIRFSDLLPAIAPLDLHLACQTVNFGQSPALGSTRILSKPQVLSYLWQCPTLPGRVGVPDRIAVRRSGYRISEDAIREAASEFLQANGLHGDLAGQGVLWPEGLQAASESFAVKVTGATWDRPQQRLQLRAQCVPRGLCNSFLIFVNQPAEAFGELVLVHPKGLSTGERETGPVVIRAGQCATLLVQEDVIRISIPVTCLQRGRLGQQIRVLDPVRRHVFRATVLAERLLRLEPQPAGKS